MISLASRKTRACLKNTWLSRLAVETKKSSERFALELWVTETFTKRTVVQFDESCWTPHMSHEWMEWLSQCVWWWYCQVCLWAPSGANCMTQFFQLNTFCARILSHRIFQNPQDPRVDGVIPTILPCNNCQQLTIVFWGHRVYLGWDHTWGELDEFLPGTSLPSVNVMSLSSSNMMSGTLERFEQDPAEWWQAGVDWSLFPMFCCLCLAFAMGGRGLWCVQYVAPAGWMDGRWMIGWCWSHYNEWRL